MSRAASLAELFEHSAWVLQLARSLVGEAAAGDVAQETMLAALRKPPEATQPVRPWLHRVVQNFASKWRRAETRRRAHERHAAARDDSVPSAAEIAESSETFRVLLDEVAGLDRALREVVTLRYMRSLDSTRIGEQLGIPPGTVRARLKRGLEALRVRLDARHGGNRTRWQAGFTAILGYGVPAAPVASLATPAWCAAAVVAVSGIGAWSWLGSLETGESATSSTPVAIPIEVAVATSVMESPQEDKPSSPRTDVAPHGPAKFHLPNLDPSHAGVHVRVLDANNRPVPHGLLEWTKTRNAFGQTNRDGYAVMAFQPPANGTQLEFHISATGRATRVVRGFARDAQWLDLGDITLPTARNLRGEVVDANGNGCANVRVLVTAALDSPEAHAEAGPTPWTDFAIEEVRTRSDGSFRIEQAPDIPIRVWAFDRESEFAFSDVIEPSEGGTVDGIRLEHAPLDPRHRVAGRVLSPTGEPVPEAWVRYAVTDGSAFLKSRRRLPSVETGADGTFEFPARLGVTYQLLVVDDGTRWSDVTIDGVRLGSVVSVQFLAR